MDNSIRLRIRDLINQYKISDRQFAIHIGVSQSVIASMFAKETEPSAKVIKMILDADENISAEWLLRGKGSIFLTDESKFDITNMLISTIVSQQETINSLSKSIAKYEQRND